MYFGEPTDYGIPFYVNGELAGWICTTTNGNYMHVLARHHIHSNHFKSVLKCKLDLMKIFGE